MFLLHRKQLPGQLPTIASWARRGSGVGYVCVPSRLGEDWGRAMVKLALANPYGLGKQDI